MDSHLDYSPLVNLSNLSAALLRLSENVEPLLSTGWMCVIAVIANLDHLQQPYDHQGHSTCRILSKRYACLQGQLQLQASGLKLLPHLF